VSGGLQGTTEVRVLDGNKRQHKDHVFGSVEGRTTWIKLDEIEEDFLKQGWADEVKEGKGLINSFVKSLDRDWEAQQVSTVSGFAGLLFWGTSFLTTLQVWGMAMVNGQRFYVRRVVCKTPAKTLTARLVYDYIQK
jgi:hypothetical protein